MSEESGVDSLARVSEVFVICGAGAVMWLFRHCQVADPVQDQGNVA